jgi:hypothetical protein
MYTLEDGSQVSDIPDNYTGWSINSYGTKEWYQDGNLHRLNGPAIEWVNRDKSWYQDGNLHRLDGPAIKKLMEINSGTIMVNDIV